MLDLLALCFQEPQYWKSLRGVLFIGRKSGNKIYLVGIEK
jgi:hypothetical protein